jgi:hypothetical protein
LKNVSRQGKILALAMKRFITITCAFLLCFAAVASAWASCKQISFAPDKHHGSAAPAHRHDHHSEGDHQHSHETAIHCPDMDEVVPVSTFSLTKELRVERLLPTFLAELASQYMPDEFDGLIHGPPGFGHASTPPPYLLFSILRI